MSTPIQFIHHNGSLSADATLYRSVISSLQYLALTRPDIAYPVNKLAQYMQAPNQTHWTTAKLILRYIKNTLHFGLHLKWHQHFQLTAYSDTNWLVTMTIIPPYMLILSTLVVIIYLGAQRSNVQLLDRQLRRSIVPLLPPLLKFHGSSICSLNLALLYLLLHNFYVIILVPHIYVPIPFFTLG